VYKKILVPVDGSEASILGLAEAIKLAKGQAASIRLMHVVNELVVTGPYHAAYAAYGVGTVIDSLRKDGKALLEQARARVGGAGVAVDTVFEESIGGQAGLYIVQQAAAWPADLIVMGTHGRRGLRRMVMGSDAEYVVRHAPVPVLLVRGQKSPEKSS
jgi:nucleotide-binding universal stress UspA family protein